MLIQSFEMDARRSGIEQGIQQGIQQGLQQGIQQGKSLGLAEGMQQGMQQGFSNGIRQTAKMMKQADCSIEFIAKMTGLTESEIENI